MKETAWIDGKGRKIEIHTMSNKWLKNIKKFLKKKDSNNQMIAVISNEINRRKNKNQKKYDTTTIN